MLYLVSTTPLYVTVVLASLRVIEATGPNPTPSQPAVFEEPLRVMSEEVPCADGRGNVVGSPSTLITPPVADARIRKVWPLLVKGKPPGVSVVLPAARLVGFPIKVTPSIV